MIVTKTKQVSQTTIVETVCDMCGTRFKGDGFDNDSLYKVAEVYIEFKEGEQYPEGGRFDMIKPDICPSCFKEKVIPFLESEGVDCSPTEVSF